MEASLVSWAMSLFDKGFIINNYIILSNSQLERFEYWHIWKYVWCFFRKWHLYFACKIWKLLIVKLIVWISFESCLENELSESHILDRRLLSVIDNKKDLEYWAKQRVFYPALWSVAICLFACGTGEGRGGWKIFWWLTCKADTRATGRAGRTGAFRWQLPSANSSSSSSSLG